MRWWGLDIDYKAEGANWLFTEDERGIKVWTTMDVLAKANPVGKGDDGALVWDKVVLVVVAGHRIFVEQAQIGLSSYLIA
jgi:hypothetical protein